MFPGVGGALGLAVPLVTVLVVVACEGLLLAKAVKGVGRGLSGLEGLWFGLMGLGGLTDG